MVSRRAVAVATAGLVLAAATAVVATFEIAGNPFEAEPAPVATVRPMPTSVPHPAASVLTSAASGTPTVDDLATLLEEPLASEELGSRVGAVVSDLATGEVLYERDGDAALTPASTLKLLTAAAVLEVLGPDRRFETRVVAGDEFGDLVIVGGGDPTLVTDESPMPRSTPLADLADRAAETLAEAGIAEVRLGFDDSLFTGPGVNPDWEPSYVPGGQVAPVAALAVDGGRAEPGQRAREDDPALAAAVAFAKLLEDNGVAVDGEPARAAAPAGGAAHSGPAEVTDEALVAVVESAPLTDIVEHMVASSDNDMAEILARHVALGLGQPGSSKAATAAIAEVLDRLGLDTSGVTVLDGSGLARGSAVPARVLADLLVLAGDPAHPQLRPVLTGLPVAAFNGTLLERVVDAPGQVRAKTGTLSLAGVHSLAGVVTAGDGGAYAFAVLANEAENALASRAALDEVAAALARCGCR